MVMYGMYAMYAMYALYAHTLAWDKAWTLYGRPYIAYMQNSIQPHIQRAAHLRCEEACEDLDTI